MLRNHLLMVHTQLVHLLPVGWIWSSVSYLCDNYSKQINGIVKCPVFSCHVHSHHTATGDKLNNPELKVLLRELRRFANEWEDIGIELDIEEGQLRQINKGGDSKACLCEMLRVWLSHVAPPPSWSAMADSLDTLGHQDMAAHLRSSYCQ